MADSPNQPEARHKADVAELAVAVVGGLGLALIAMFLCVVSLTGQIAGVRDFVVFWATGQQLVHHANPYDPQAMMLIERTAGLAPGYGVLFMRNPPWALPLVYLLGFIGLRAGALLWSLLLVGCLALSVRLLWLLAGRPRNRLHWLGYSFAPALICLFVGQTTLFSLLGLALFLYFHRTRPWVAGASLWLCALKPHLFLPFGVVLLLWVCVARSYKLLTGAALAMGASCAAAWYMAPTAWTAYGRMMQASTIEREFIPCLSDALRLWLSPQTLWLQYLPAILACAWALSFYWPRRNGWDWNRDGGLLMLVSLLTAPYCWLYDQGLAIPALLHGAYTTRSRTLLVLLALASILIEAELCGIRITSLLYLWTAPAWLAWYVAARVTAQRRTDGNASPQPAS